MALALNNLKRVDMPLNKEAKPTKPNYSIVVELKLQSYYYAHFLNNNQWKVMRLFIHNYELNSTTTELKQK